MSMTGQEAQPMKKSARFPLPYRIWIITSGAVFAAAMGLELFFSETGYGFLYDNELLLVCFVSFAVLLIGLTVWLCRRVLKRDAIKVLVSVACGLLAYHCLWGYGFATRGSYRVHTSPGGTNRVVLVHSPNYPLGLIRAYPMRNRWIYEEADNGYVRGDFWHADGEYVVAWPSERQAVVTTLRESTDPDELSKITVDFE